MTNFLILQNFLYGLHPVRPRLITATHNSRCLEAFHYSNAVSGWWSIATWAPLFVSIQRLTYMP